VAIGLVYLILLMILSGIGWLILPPLVEQARALLAKGLEL